jgi:hypothetical protein
MKTTRDELSAALAQLSVLYPTMRFGQLLEMLASLSGAESVREIERTSDETLLQAATDHIVRRSKQLELGPIDLSGLWPERQHLLASFLVDAKVGEPLARISVQLASEGGTTLYDVEDEFLIAKISPQTALA